MGFSIAQYEAAIDKLSTGLGDLSEKLQRVHPTVAQATNHWYVTDEMALAASAIGDQLLDIGGWILDKLKELMEGAAAPVLMFVKASDWEDIRGIASGVAGQLHPEALAAGHLWHGSAADAYAKQVPPQSTAATRIATIADKTATSLDVCAVAGLTFYMVLGAILVKFIAAFIAALTALGTVVFSWAGAALIVEEAGVNTAVIVAAVTALVALLGAQATQLVTLHGEAVDASAFPGGHWPNAVVSQFDDATVSDGDADWSLRK